MTNKPVSINSNFCRFFPLISIQSRFSFFSQIMMTITIFILFVAFLPCISSSPTPTISTGVENNNDNKIISDSNAFMYDSQTSSREDFPSFASAVRDRSLSPSPFFDDQARAHANQFLISHLNDNRILVPKWFTHSNYNDDDDYVPADFLINKRASFYNMGGYQNMKKRKQLTKPPMEVMNEIVNSIYLKR